MTDLILPVVHLNGTSRDELIEQRITFGQALRAALDALAKAAPNGRDYYVEPGRLEAATAQFQRRADTLRALLKETEAEIEALDE